MGAVEALAATTAQRGSRGMPCSVQPGSVPKNCCSTRAAFCVSWEAPKARRLVSASRVPPQPAASSAKAAWMFT